MPKTLPAYWKNLTIKIKWSYSEFKAILPKILEHFLNIEICFQPQLEAHNMIDFLSEIPYPSKKYHKENATDESCQMQKKQSFGMLIAMLIYMPTDL